MRYIEAVSNRDAESFEEWSCIAVFEAAHSHIRARHAARDMRYQHVMRNMYDSNHWICEGETVI